jgi:hypothetical protein
MGNFRAMLTDRNKIKIIVISTLMLRELLNCNSLSCKISKLIVVSSVSRFDKNSSTISPGTDQEVWSTKVTQEE